MTDSLPSVTIVRRIKASPARVYAAITEPKLLMQWWGPDAGPTLSAEADVRPGGRFSIVFLLNGDEHNPTGTYREVVPEKKLVFTWEWPGMPTGTTTGLRLVVRLKPVSEALSAPSRRRAGGMGSKQPRGVLMKRHLNT
jgi:uncharacterized protein YndB with AHSA1/START domain